MAASGARNAPTVFFASIAAPPMKRLRASGEPGWTPPGHLNPALSQGCFAPGFARIHAVAASVAACRSVASSTILFFAAFGARSCWPWAMISSAGWMPMIRGSRWVPPAPGISPSVASGSPIMIFGESRVIRWWQARAISSPPPRAEPLITATTGFPDVSIFRKSPLSCWQPSSKTTLSRAL